MSSTCACQWEVLTFRSDSWTCRYLLVPGNSPASGSENPSDVPSGDLVCLLNDSEHWFTLKWFSRLFDSLHSKGEGEKRASERGGAGREMKGRGWCTDVQHVCLVLLSNLRVFSLLHLHWTSSKGIQKKHIKGFWISTQNQRISK